MSSSSCRLPGMTYMIGRRTERRVHLFRPDPLMNQIFLYCLGIAAARTGATLVGTVLMGNHYHLVVVDNEGRITELTKILNGLLTKTTQAFRGWVGAVFDSAGPSYVELCTPRAVIDKVGYTLANPTAAGLVRFSKDWPGVRTRVSDIGELTIIVARPKGVFFADEGTMPEEVELRFELPEQLIQIYGVKQARDRIAQSVRDHEAAAHAKAAEKGWAFMGADRVLKSSPYSRAKTFEERHQRRPHYAGDAEAVETAIRRDIEFGKRYAIARQRWLAGERDVVWPAGTDMMKRRHRVPCEPPG